VGCGDVRGRYYSRIKLNMKPKLSGLQRAQFTQEWIKRGKPPTKEDFVKRCCEAMNLEYTPPPDVKRYRDMIVSKGASMFPVKESKDGEK